MQKNGIAATFHYVPLHKSKMASKFKRQKLNITEDIYSRIVRLPLYPSMKRNIQLRIISKIKKFVYDQE